MEGENQFGVVDYVVFSLTVVISLVIGVYYALSGGRQRTTSEYLVGGRLINFIPVTISLLVTFESSIMMLGMPAEGYFHGIQYLMSSIGSTFAHIIAVYLAVPLIHPLKITSAYQYLEYRFKSRAVRLFGTCLGMLHYVFYMGVVLFGPAIALEAVTGFPQWASIITVSLVSVIYTSIGGIKAVVWTDVFQATVMFAGVFAFLIKGTMEVGGPKQVWDTAMAGDRLHFFNFDTNPKTRLTFWGLTIGTFFRHFSFSFNQSTVQRISSTKTMAAARKVLWIVTPCFAFVTFISLYEGIVAYAYFQTKQCDPYKSKKISNQNQVLPYMVMEIYKELPGMPGLFLASLFSASLSTLSSGLSSLSALLWTDIVHPFMGNISDFKGTIIAKLSVLVFGGIACGLAFMVSLIGGIIHQIASGILAAFSCPLSGMFVLGCFSPRTNAKGVITGGIAGLVISCWISFGMNFSPSVKPSTLLPPASTDQCYAGDAMTQVTASYLSQDYNSVNLNFSTGSIESTTPFIGTTARIEGHTTRGVEELYDLSYMWLSLFGFFTTVIVGYVTSLITGPNKPGDVDPRYLLNFCSVFLFFCPCKFQKWLSSFGTQFNKEEYKVNKPDPALTEQLLDQEMVFSPPAKWKQPV